MCEEKANTAEPQMGFGAEFDFKVLKDSLQVSYRACDDQNGYQIFTDAFQFIQHACVAKLLPTEIMHQLKGTTVID